MELNMLMSTYTNRSKTVFYKDAKVYHRILGFGTLINEVWYEGNYAWNAQFTNDDGLVNTVVFESTIFPAYGRCFKCRRKHVATDENIRVTAKSRRFICTKCIKSANDLLM